MNLKNKSKILVVGHRNPDTDSIASSVAAAEFKRMTGEKNVMPVRLGPPGARAQYIFEKFKVPLPPLIHDVYPRVRDIVNPETPAVPENATLFEALGELERRRLPRLPVIGADRKYRGMICLYSLLGDLLQLRSSGSGLTGRRIHTSLQLIKKVLSGESLNVVDGEAVQDFEVYVGAMDGNSFKRHIPSSHSNELAIIVGDRDEIHRLAINMNCRLLIITGENPVRPDTLELARAHKVSIIQTAYDSATVVRRLKFSTPVIQMLQNDLPRYRLDDRLKDIRKEVLSSYDDVFPVLNRQKLLVGTFKKSDFDLDNTTKLVLVDHNEFDQSVPGIEETPVIEVIDHHRLGMPPTNVPIKITCDTVGSTSTLITEMFLSAGLKIPYGIAGILMGGIVTDTLMLRSPTSCGRDKLALEHLHNLTGVDPEALMNEIFQVGSLIARSTPAEVINSDRKLFHHLDKYTFAVSQVEEVGFEEFQNRAGRLLRELDHMVEQEKLDFAGLLITDVVHGNSRLLVCGQKNIIEHLPFRQLGDHLFDLPGVLSRKKQVLPQLLSTLDQLEK